MRPPRPRSAGARGRRLAEALVGAAESRADWANATPGVSARQAAATLMNFAWAGLGDLMEDRPRTPPAGDLTAPTALT
ncbi:hypothetical protein TNCT6_25780 [Streptomyces sp. 6-11-2]|nr:hypothetical protein TNCT6_25780 [Streptomyces sp. 6-11-2]